LGFITPCAFFKINFLITSLVGGLVSLFCPGASNSVGDPDIAKQSTIFFQRQRALNQEPMQQLTHVRKPCSTIMARIVGR